MGAHVQDRVRTAFIADETTIDLLAKARAGDRNAVEALLERCLPSLKRWAHGRLPAAARAFLDTGDIVQEAALHAIRRLETFEPRHVGAMQAYLRQSVINRIIDEVRRVARQPVAVELEDNQLSNERSPLEDAIEAETYDRYRAALAQLKPRQREIVVARIDLHWSISQIMERFEFPSIDASRMAITRALRRLAVEMQALANVG